MAEQRDEPLDGLRRRLYAPGATAADVERYLVAVPPPGAEPQPADHAPAPPAIRSRRLPLVLLAGVAAVGLVAAVALAQRAPAPEPPAPPPVAAPEVQRRLPFPSAASAELVAALDAGEQAGIRRYLYEHPEARPTAISTVSRADSAEFTGEGPTSVPLRPSSLAATRGRFTVLVTLDEPGRYEWRGTRMATTNDRSGPSVPIAIGSGVLGPGQVGTATFAYEAGAPTALLVLVGRGVRWGAVVVYTD